MGVWGSGLRVAEGFNIFVISALVSLRRAKASGVKKPQKQRKRPDVFPLRVLYWSTPDIAEILRRAAGGRRYKKPHFIGSGQAAAFEFLVRFLGAVQG